MVGRALASLRAAVSAARLSEVGRGGMLIT